MQRELDERRARLAQLLSAEEAVIQSQINYTVETPENRRDRLKRELSHLKGERQAEEDRIVAEKREQGWREQCDPLRKKITDAFTRRIAQERKQQVIDKEERIMQEKAEEVKYAEYAKAELAEHNARLEQEREERQMKIERNKRVWDS